MQQGSIPGEKRPQTQRKFGGALLTLVKVDWSHPVEDNYTNIVDPRTWTASRKQFTVMTVSCYAFLASVSSSIVAPALINIADDFGIENQVLRSFVLSIYYVGFVIGALPYGPLSEVFGRTTTLNVSTALYVIFNLASGFAQNTGQLLAFRLLSGIGGSACISVSLPHWISRSPNLLLKSTMAWRRLVNAGHG